MERKQISKDRAQEIQEKLEQGVREIFESGKYAEYVATMSRFPHYSSTNCILIASQCPGASLVCGYKKWQTDFNRTVKRKERGIMIIAPFTYKVTVNEPVLDEQQRPVLDAGGKQMTEPTEEELRSFRPVYVFDLSQTSGAPLPSLVKKLDGRVEDFAKLKDALVAVSPVPVSFETINGKANGYFSPAEHRIVVKSDMPELQTIKTLLHEMAHATLEHGSKEDRWNRTTKEVQAESVAYWITQMLELDTSDYSFGYISGWSRDKEVTELKENLDLIKKTAEGIMAHLEEELLKTTDKEKELDIAKEQQPVPCRKSRSR